MGPSIDASESVMMGGGARRMSLLVFKMEVDTLTSTFEYVVK